MDEEIKFYDNNRRRRTSGTRSKPSYLTQKAEHPA
jgi:hypothetical protein